MLGFLRLSLLMSFMGLLLVMLIGVFSDIQILVVFIILILIPLAISKASKISLVEKLPFGFPYGVVE